MGDMITRLFCAFGAAFSTWFFKIIPIKQETDQELTLKRFELYKNLYFNLLINFDLKYWMCYADFFTLYIEHLENKNQEIYLLLDPLSRKYIKNTSAYFKRVQKEKEIKNKLQLYIIKNNIRKANKSIKREFINIQSKLGYPIRRKSYLMSNILLFLDIVLITSILSFYDLYNLFPFCF